MFHDSEHAGDVADSEHAGDVAGPRRSQNNSTRITGADRQEGSQGELGDWNADVELLLQNWHQRVYAAQAAHYAAADRYRLLNYLVGIPAVVFSSIVGTAIFAGRDHKTPEAPLAAFASILAAVLAGLQTSFASRKRPPSTGRRPTGTRPFDATSRK
jgi:hypothetical protein